MSFLNNTGKSDFLVDVEHQSFYSYSSPVFLDTHILKLHPKPYLNQNILSFDLLIDPKPKTLNTCIGVDGSIHYILNFENKMVNEFNITSKIQVKTKPFNPFDYLRIKSKQGQFPVSYTDYETQLLSQYMNTPSMSAGLLDYAISLSQDKNPIDFLMHLTTSIHHDYKYESREFGYPYTADQTFALKKGSCRDLAVLMIEIARYHSIAARFVTGYQYNQDQNHDLHAWVELYIPEFGWRGFDPSSGLAVNEYYLPLCTAPDYRYSYPITGTFRGLAKSSLVSRVLMSEL